MYLKTLSNKKPKQFNNNYPFVSGTWYVKMNEDGSKARNMQGKVLYTCMVDFELRSALASKEFTGVEN